MPAELPNLMVEYTSNEPPSSDPQRAEPPIPQSYKLYRSEELFGGSRIVCIEHAGSLYKLQITSRGKLILQK